MVAIYISRTFARDISRILAMDINRTLAVDISRMLALDISRTYPDSSSRGFLLLNGGALVKELVFLSLRSSNPFRRVYRQHSADL